MNAAVDAAVDVDADVDADVDVNVDISSNADVEDEKVDMDSVMMASDSLKTMGFKHKRRLFSQIFLIHSLASKRLLST